MKKSITKGMENHETYVYIYIYKYVYSIYIYIHIYIYIEISILNSDLENMLNISMDLLRNSWVIQISGSFSGTGVSARYCPRVFYAEIEDI